MRHLFRRHLIPLVVTLCLALSACSSSAAQPFDPQATAKALLDSSAFSQPLEEMDQETACGVLYHIESSGVTGCSVYTSLSAGAEEIAVLTFSSEDAAKTGLEALQQRVSDQKEALESYQPDEVGKLDNAILEQRGSSVLLVVANDKKAAEAVILDKG